MNDNIIIDVRKITKRYLIGARTRTKNNNKWSLSRIASIPFNYLRHSLRPTEQEVFWALKGIDMQIKRGEVVGIMGPNGAGKTTLLKVLSRITTPTTGYAVIKGQIGSLLGAGAGFHPELTGRENVYINGAILGMHKSEIDECFEKILEFSEIQDFIETPVKRYSSGMFARLGFSVAAHLKTDILIIDEILATGDRGFRRKSLSKMAELSKAGRTVIIVTHNINHLTAVCERGYVLDKGRLIYDDQIDEAVSFYNEHYIQARYGQYQQKKEIVKNTTNLTSIEKGNLPSKDTNFSILEISQQEDSQNDLFSMAVTPIEQTDTDGLQIYHGMVTDDKYRLINKFSNFDRIFFNVLMRINELKGNEDLLVTCFDESSSPIFTFILKSALNGEWPQSPGEYIFRLEVPNLLLRPGNYELLLKIKTRKPNRLLYTSESIKFQITESQSHNETAFCDAAIRVPIYSNCKLYSLINSDDAKIIKGWPIDSEGNPLNAVNYEQPVLMHFILMLRNIANQYKLTVGILNEDSETVMRSEANYNGVPGQTNCGCIGCDIHFPGSTLKPGNYGILARLYDGNGVKCDTHSDVFRLIITAPIGTKGSLMKFPPNSLIAPSLKWQFDLNPYLS